MLNGRWPHGLSSWNWASRRFQPGEGPSRGLLRDCTTSPINWFAALIFLNISTISANMFSTYLPVGTQYIFCPAGIISICWQVEYNQNIMGCVLMWRWEQWGQIHLATQTSSSAQECWWRCNETLIVSKHLARIISGHNMWQLGTCEVRGHTRSGDKNTNKQFPGQ